MPQKKKSSQFQEWSHLGTRLHRECPELHKAFLAAFREHHLLGKRERGEAGWERAGLTLTHRQPALMGVIQRALTAILERDIPRLSVPVSKVEKAAVAHAARSEGLSESEWLQVLVRDWDGRTRLGGSRRQQHLTVRLSSDLHEKLERLTERSRLSPEETLRQIVESTLGDG